MSFNGFNGWMLPDQERARVLENFPPRYAISNASHITRELDNSEIPVDASIEIIGYSCGESLEALICRVDGETVRPDGKLFHLTLSFEEGRAAKEANIVIEEMGWTQTTPFPIETRGFLFYGGAYLTTPLTEK